MSEKQEKLKTNPSVVKKIAKLKAVQKYVVSYIRWGNTTLNKGTAVGGHHTDKGGPSNLMCLPVNPMCYTYNQV